MSKPQQPEIGATGDPGDIGRIPEDQFPGHHPTVEQDKPSGEAFLEKLREHASSAETTEATEDDEPSELADRAAEAVGKPFEAAADLLQKVRDRLDDHD